MKTAIVLLNWNGKKLLEKFLPGVIAHSPGAEVVVADNSSTDDSISFLENTFPDVRVIRLDKNLGFAGGYNAALRQVDATYYILLNTDVEVTPGWHSALEAFMDAHPDCAACQPSILSYTHKDHYEHAGAAGGFIDRLGYPFCRGRIFNAVEKADGRYNDPIEVFWATGACCIVRAKAFHDLEGFDDVFFAHMEEIDLCWRFRRAGLSVYCLPEARVYHLGGGTLSAVNPHKTYLNCRNNLMMLHKNLPPGRVFSVLLTRFFLDGIALLKFTTGGSPREAWAIIRAYAWFYSHLGVRRGVRRRLMNAGVPFPVKCVYQGSLVVEFFIRKNHRFSDLRKKFS